MMLKTAEEREYDKSNAKRFYLSLLSMYPDLSSHNESNQRMIKKAQKSDADELLKSGVILAKGKECSFTLDELKFHSCESYRDFLKDSESNYFLKTFQKYFESFSKEQVEWIWSFYQTRRFWKVPDKLFLVFGLILGDLPDGWPKKLPVVLILRFYREKLRKQEKKKLSK